MDTMVSKALSVGELSTEVGETGLSRWGTDQYNEWLRRLQGRRGLREYREMKDNDDIVGAILFAIQKLAGQVDWRVEPGDDSPEAGARAAFVQGALMDDQHTTWSDLVSEILSMLWAGFAPFEVVYKIRGGDTEDRTRRSRFTDGKLGWRKWAIRAQETVIDDPVFDDAGGLQGFRQQVSGRPPVVLPIGKMLLFRTAVDRGSPFGRSILRNAFVSYYYKKNIQQIEGIGIERDLAGYPVFQTVKPDVNGPQPPDLWNTNDPKMVALKTNLERSVRLIKRDEQEGMILPWWIDFKLVSAGASGGRRTFDTNAVIQRLDSRIAMTCLADFILLGSDKVGSFALSRNKTSLFSVALDGFMRSIAGVVNQFAIPQLYRVNGWPTATTARLAPGNVEQVDLVSLGEWLTKLAGAGYPLFPNRALELHLANLSNLPAPTEEVALTGDPSVDDPDEPAPAHPNQEDQ